MVFCLQLRLREVLRIDYNGGGGEWRKAPE